MRDIARRGLAVGFFDGVHIGHQAVLRRASSALTFSRHPLSVLAPDRAPRLLMDVNDRVEAIKACGVDDVLVLDFNQDLANMPADEFVRKYLSAADGSRTIWCGSDWRFGRGGKGDAAMLRECGFAVNVVQYAECLGARVSSTRIRAAVESGDMVSASAMLGRPWSLHGEVFSGKGLGCEMGFPTVNVRPSGLELRLRLGVYRVEVGGAPAVANYGMAPTLGERAWREPVLELHFTGGVPDLSSGGSVAVSFLGFIRPERTFASLEELRRQIAKDVEGA